MQSPLLSVPLKATSPADVTTPIAELITTSYEQDPGSYEEELQLVMRARQDAVTHASSDATGRDLLYKWFHMLEMLELRFPELRATFVWRDAFMGAETAQQSLAFEKASILFNIAARISAIAAAAPRHEAGGDGLKRAYTGCRQAAGMLAYINHNFLHAPSMDLGNDVVQLLTKLMLAQASEVFLEKSVHDAKGAPLVAKLASHVAAEYTALYEEMNELQAGASLPAFWLQLMLCKSRYFTSVMQYYRALADDAAGAHGTALVRLTVAEGQAKEAVRYAGGLSLTFAPSVVRNTVPADAPSAVAEMARSHQGVCAERKRIAAKDNDLIYHEMLPPESTLPPVERTSVATPIPIRDVYATPEVQRVLGPPVFQRLIPFSVHESASKYSEEKAKLVRAEAQRIETGNRELQASLRALELPGALDPYRPLLGRADTARAALAEPPGRVRRWAAELADGAGAQGLDALAPRAAGVDAALAQVQSPRREALARRLEHALEALADDDRACERGRVRFAHRWTQEPSAAATRTLRRDLRSNDEALRNAASVDERVAALWHSVRDDVALLEGDAATLAEAYATAPAPAPSGGARGGAGGSLLDLDESADASQTASTEDARTIAQKADEHLATLQRLPAERAESLAALKQHVHTDDIAQLLLLNRRVQNVEPGLFASELAKFRPYQAQIARSLEQQETLLSSVAASLRGLARHPGTAELRSAYAARRQARDTLTERLSRAYHAYNEVRSALGKALRFYEEMDSATQQLADDAERTLAQRREERARLQQELDWDARGETPPHATAPPPPAAPPAAGSTSLEDDLRALHLSTGQGARAPPPPPGWPGPPPLLSQAYGRESESAPPPPQRPPRPY